MVCFSFLENKTVRDCILDRLQLASLMAFGATSRYHRACVCDLLEHRIICHISRFSLNPIAFFAALRQSSGVLSGSAALGLLFWAENRNWEANDLDVYVPRDRCNLLLQFLFQQGYMVAVAYTSSLYLAGSIRSVTSLRCGAYKVDVIESQSMSPLSPIFEYHLSAVMNYISADGIFSAYPSLTAAKRAIVNPMLFDRGEVKLPTLDAILKYRARGFSIQSTTQAWLADHQPDNVRHRCGETIACPATHRTTEDEGAFRMRLDRLGGNMSTGEQLGAVYWRLGGRHCSAVHGYDKPYVQLT